jgi:hypothetical protein
LLCMQPGYVSCRGMFAKNAGGPNDDRLGNAHTRKDNRSRVIKYGKAK